MANTDYTKILDALPLPEKYLLSRSSRTAVTGSQGSWESDENDPHLLPPSKDSRDPDPGNNDVNTTKKRGSWGSADTGLDRLGSSDSSLDDGFAQLPTRSRLSDVRAHSLGGSPILERRRRGDVLSKPLSTENILAKVRELLGNQTARAKVTGIVEAQKAVLRVQGKHQGGKTDTEAEKSRKSGTEKDTGRIKSPRTHHDVTSDEITSDALKNMTLSTNSPLSKARIAHNSPSPVPDISMATPGSRNRRAVKNTHSIELINPRIWAPKSSHGDQENKLDPGKNSELSSDRGLSSLGFSRSSDSVPTAHVIPSPLIQSHSASSSNLASRTGHVAPKQSRSVMAPSYPAEDSLHVTGSRRDYSRDESLPVDPTEQWSSHHNLAGSPMDAKEFHALQHDPNVTEYPASTEIRKKIGMATPRHASSRKHDTLTTTESMHSYQDRGGYSYTKPQTYNPQAYSQNTADVYMTYPSSDNFTADLTTWQQKHQEALRRQQLEATQVPMMSAPQYVHPGHIPGSAPVPGSAPSTVLLSDPHKLDAIKLAADNIIREKDMIIDRQKVKIGDLEQRTKESHLDRQRALLQRTQDDNETLNVRIQDPVFDNRKDEELQYDNATLKAQLTECTASHSSSHTELQQKLGACEYEIQRLKLQLEQEIAQKAKELGLFTDKLKVQESAVSEWQDKCGEERRQKEVLQRQLEGMERYLDDLPTADEHSRRQEELKSLRREAAKQQQHTADLEKRLTDTERGVKSRDGLIESLEANEKQLKKQLDKAEGDNERLRERMKGEGIPVDDIEELQYEIQRLKADLDKAKKLLETKHKRQQQSEVHHRSELSALEERLNQEESAVTALREEVRTKDHNLLKLRQSFKELGAQNQDLMEKNMSLQDTIQELDRQLSGDIHKLETRLLRELSVCFTELHSLVQICVQHAEGQDPNISALLGVKASLMGEPDAESEASDVASLKYKVSMVRDMRNDIDKLREIISNKYAEEMGDNLNCTTQ